ncbi:MAG: TerB family tellurite resistance protein, partial [Bryobacteraceae bacterium]
EHRAIAGVCVLAAFADGAQGEVERARIQQIVSGFSGGGLDVAAVYQDVLGGKFSLTTAPGQLQSQQSRALAYEMAVCVCNADGVVNDAEKRFLSDLHQALQLDPSTTGPHQEAAQSMAAPPPVIGMPPISAANREAEVDRLILNAAVTNGALEIMPHTLATMAIVPLQMRMIYRIGTMYGFELDRGHIKDFLATVGIGLTSQVFEGFTRQLVGGFARRLGGGLFGGLVREATGSAFAFASTYALGHVAKKYYASCRSLSPGQLKDVFSTMLQDGRSMQGRYSGDIMQRSRQVNIAELMPLANQQ